MPLPAGEQINYEQHKRGYDFCMNGGSLVNMVELYQKNPAAFDDVNGMSYAIGFADAVMDILRGRRAK